MLYALYHIIDSCIIFLYINVKQSNASAGKWNIFLK